MTNSIRQAEIEGVIDFTRGRDWFDPSSSDAHVTMVGCGGIGSPTAMALAKLGIPKITLIDGDTVEKHNIPNQMFPLADIGRPKVDSLADVLAAYSVSEVDPIHGFVQSNGIQMVDDGLVSGRLRGVVVSGLDSMAARNEVWKNVKYNVNVPLYVDARIGGENIVIYAVDPRKPDQCKRYEENALSFTDEEAVPLPCTRRSIIDVGFIVASMLTRVVRRHLAGEQIEHTLFWNHAGLNAMAVSDDHEAQLAG